MDGILQTANFKPHKESVITTRQSAIRNNALPIIPFGKITSGIVHQAVLQAYSNYF